MVTHILHKNRLLKRVIKEKIEDRIDVMEGRGRRRKRLFYDFKEMSGYWKLKEVALVRTLWRIALVETMDLS